MWAGEAPHPAGGGDPSAGKAGGSLGSPAELMLTGVRLAGGGGTGRRCRPAVALGVSAIVRHSWCWGRKVARLLGLVLAGSVLVKTFPASGFVQKGG